MSSNPDETIRKGIDDLPADLEEPPISQEDKKEKKLAIVEIFGPTIQGEGPHAGMKTMFIRFGGCDYRCVKCDSLHAVLPTAVRAHARYMTPDEIIDELVEKRGNSGTHWVVFSGGNPCMWDLNRLISYVHGAGFGIAVETQGTILPDWLIRCQQVTISPKSPGMGEKFEPDKYVAMITRLYDAGTPFATKVVVFSALDIEFAVEVWNIMNTVVPINLEPFMMLSLGNPYPPIITQEGVLRENPSLTGESKLDDHSDRDHRLILLDNYRQLLEEYVQDPRIHHMRFLPQLHVLAWGNETGR